MVRIWMKWDHSIFGGGEYEAFHPTLDKAMDDLRGNLDSAKEDGGYTNMQWTLSN